MTNISKTNRVFFTGLSFVLGILAFGQPAAAQEQASGPTIAIIIQEKVMGVLGTTAFEQPSQAELTIAEHFRARGFNVLDSSTLKRNVTQAKGLRLLEGDNKGAAATGLQYGAQYFVLGTSIAKPAGAKIMGTQLQSIQATLTARVVHNNDAAIIATGNANAAQAHIDEVQGGVMAIEKAAKELAQSLATQIAQLEARQEGDGSRLTLAISGLVSFRHLDFVMSYLESEMEGAEAVELRTYANSVATITLDYAEDHRAFARAVSRKRFTGFRIEPTYVSADRIDLKTILEKKK